MKRQRKQLFFYLTLIGITLLAVSIAILRLDETSTDDNSIWVNLAATFFLLFCTLGPTLIAKFVLKTLIPVEQLTRNLRRVKKEIKEAKKPQAAAQQEIDRIEMSRRWYEQEQPVIEDAYKWAYRQGTAKAQNPYRNFLRLMR